MSTELGVSKPTAPNPRFDAVGIFFITGCSIWTVLIPCGMTFLWHKRQLPFLKIRHLGLTFTATILLHLYWISIEIGYTLAPLEPEVAVFWTMGVLYPFGLGLFFAGNAQLLHVAKMQEKYAKWNESSDSTLFSKGSHGVAQPKNVSQRIWWRFQQLDFSVRTSIIVGIGTAFQLLSTVVMFLISRKFHSSWGIPGTAVTGTPLQRNIKQGQGWEWWPIIAWQFFWYWIVAPITLWRARKIQDTHGWRMQTTVCCLSGLSALPMWLIALYVPGMAPCNQYWIPVQWIGISIWFIEAFTVWIPCYQVFRHQALQQETLDTIATWENRTRKSPSRPSSSSGQTHGADTFKTLNSMERGREKPVSFESSSAESVYTMEALEHTLLRNPEPLRQFSALRDFSGENIAFLTSTREWKAKWPTSTMLSWSRSGEHDPLLHELFKRAVYLYANYVNPRYAEFPINISSHDLRRLDTLFGKAARVLYGDSTTTSLSGVTPFEDLENWPLPMSPRPMPVAPSSTVEDDITLLDFVTERVQYWGDIPQDFNSKVFDDVEQSIKYLVLTNTWPKFVKERRGEQERERNTESSNSNSSKGSKYFAVLNTFKTKTPL